MDSIFNIEEWEANKVYYKNSIVIDSGTIYYALKTHSSSIFDRVNNFGGVLTIGQTELPNFIWKPSYGSKASFAPPVRTIKMGDGYEQNYAANIKKIIIEHDLIFENRNDLEAMAIYHFLWSRNGKDVFYWEQHSQFSKISTFIAKDIVFQRNFFNNNSINVKFMEKPSYQTIF